MTTDLSPPRRALWTALSLIAAAALALAAAPVAGATITSTRIEQPASPFFSIFDEASPSPITISGTTDSTDPTNDSVDVYCYDNGGGARSGVYLGVPLAPDGSFSVAANPQYLASQTCRLIAVPSGTEPSVLSEFVGPLTAVGRNRAYQVESGPNTGVTEDFYLLDQQIFASDDYDSLSSCGLSSARLRESTFAYATTTFNCNDWYGSGRFGETPAGSQIQVDGIDAYAAFTAAQIEPQATGLPPVSYAYSQNPFSGDLTLHETEPLVRCADPTWPPTPARCSSFVDLGVRDDRTIEQTEDGKLVWITDRFVSADGQAHSLHLLSQQYQKFGNLRGDEIAYRFPGQSTFTHYGEGATVAFEGSSPGTVYIDVEGAPDGDANTGRGAIVFDRPSSPATFNGGEPSASGFYFDQTVAVPAGGSATVRFAYAQALYASEVETLAAEAQAAFASSAPPGPGPATGPSATGAAITPAPTAPTSKPSNAFRFGRRVLDRAHGTARLTVAVPAAGTLDLSGRSVRSVARRAGGPVSLTLPVRPSAAVLRRLRAGHRVPVTVHVRFTPAGGSPLTRSTQLVLVAKGGG